MRRVTVLAVAALLSGAFAATSFATTPVPPAAKRVAVPVAPPQVRIWSPQARIPITLDRADVSAEVVGHVARTRIELVLRNPNDQTLEGELQFPLHEGQIVTGFALDMGRELRRAVPVDKARGQQVFEDVTRARVDPALLEATQGNNYKLRVYPIPGRGTRRVVLELSEQLPQRRQGRSDFTRLDLPLEFAAEVGQLDVDLRIADVPLAALGVEATGMPSQDLQTQQRVGWSQVQVHRARHRGAAALHLDIPSSPQPVVATSTNDQHTIFYAELPFALHTMARPTPRTVAIQWDASGSGAARDHEREFALLDAYFHQNRQVEVQLTIVRDVAEPARRFSVSGARWDELRKALAHVAYDGATNAAALTAVRDVDMALVFTDGLGNWGEPASPQARVPTYTISSTASVDAQRLTGLAQRSGAEWLDLQRIDTAGALKSLLTRRARVAGLRGNGASQLVARLPGAGDTHLALSGQVNRLPASVTIDVLEADGRVTTQTVAIAERTARAERSERDASRSALVPLQWATMRIAELEEDHDAHRAEIRRIGREFGLVTRETSLIVLDAVTDYVRYEIEPPLALRAEYERLLAQQGRRIEADRSAHLENVLRRFKEQTAWWEREFPKGDIAKWEDVERKRAGGGLQESEAPQDARPRRDEVSRAQPAQANAARQSTASPPMPVMAPAPAAAERAMAGNGMAADAAKAKASPEGAASAQATIQLSPWAPDSAYARRLRDATRDQVYQRYLDERPDFVNSTAFFLDAADVMFDKGLPELGLRVLSNLAEMNLENRHILRVLGYRLLQARQPVLAVRVFKDVQRLSPEEPQSYRDLGLAHADAAQWQDAADQLWRVVARPWDGRFPDIDLTALAELNAVIARAQLLGQPVRTQGFDARLLRNLPLDLRIVLSWDADNTDIDLWVIDPNGEKAFYGHRLTHQGGRMSQDVTGGYGPEEFALRRAKPGHYVVQAQFYGHRQQIVAPATTLMMRLTTGFGTARQKEELTTLRLDGPSAMVTVGGFDVAGN